MFLKKCCDKHCGLLMLCLVKYCGDYRRNSEFCMVIWTRIYKLGLHSQQTQLGCLLVQLGKIINTVQNHMDFPRFLLSQRALLYSPLLNINVFTCKSKLSLIASSCGSVTKITQVLSEHLQYSGGALNFRHLLPQVIFQFSCCISRLSSALYCHLWPTVQSSVCIADKINKFWKQKWKKSQRGHIRQTTH